MVYYPDFLMKLERHKQAQENLKKPREKIKTKKDNDRNQNHDIRKIGI